MADRQARELTGVGLALLAAVAWVVAWRVPWFSAGAPGSTAPLDVAELLGSAVLGVPAAAGWAGLLVPAAALLQLGLAPLRGVPALLVRVVLWVLTTASGLVLAYVLGRLSAQVVGPGVLLAVLAWVLGGASLCCATVRTPASAHGPEPGPGISPVAP